VGNVDTELLPRNIEAERAVLGAVFIDPNAIYRIGSIVNADDFHDERHARIYQVMHSLSTAGSGIDLLTVFDVLERENKNADGAYLAELANTVPTSLHAEHYARLVANYATRRRLIAAAAIIAKEAYDTATNDPLGAAHRALLDVGRNGDGGLRSITEAASSFYDQVEYWSGHPLEFGQVRGLSSGIPSLDYMTEGLQPSDLILLAGRPGMGKSAFGFEIGRRVAKGGAFVALFSLEMPREKVVARWASAISGIDSNRIKRGICPDKHRNTYAAPAYVSPAELGRYLAAVAEINGLPLAIDDSPAPSGDDIRSRSLALANRAGPLGLVIVDHTGLMRSQGKAGENSAKTEGRKSQQMKQLAKELRCPVILVQQLSRAVEARENKRPGLSDLRDSGEHEQNADIVIALYRESYYKAMTEGSKGDMSVEVLCLKHRDGAAYRSRNLRYDRKLSRFDEWTDEEEL
jgi:replicative DNA helicase